MAEDITTMLIYGKEFIHGLRLNIPLPIFNWVVDQIWLINLNYTQTHDMVGYTHLHMEKVNSK